MNDPLKTTYRLIVLSRLYSCLGDFDRAQAYIDELEALLQSPGGSGAKEYVLLDLARFAYQRDRHTEALRRVVEGLQLTGVSGGRSVRADYMTAHGHILAALQRSTEAASSYEAALADYAALGLSWHAVEPRTGLADIALQAGDSAQALAHVRQLLPLLATYPLLGNAQTLPIFLTCYQILVAHQDPAALTVLARGYELLHQNASHIADNVLRQTYLELPAHRALQTAFAHQASST